MAPTLPISNITLSSTNDSIPTPFFGLQDAMDAKYKAPTRDFDSPSLFPNACMQQDGTRNCTAACMDPQQMFASLDTLHNCAVWPSIIVESHQNDLQSSAVTLARSLGLEPVNESLSLPSNISNTLQTCLLAACEDDDECGQHVDTSFSPGEFQRRFDTPLTGDLYYGMNDSLAYFNPCQHINAPATADVAGIGVFISYAMQMGLALITFILAMPWKSATRGVRNGIWAVWSKRRAKKEPSKSKNPAVPRSVHKELEKRTNARIMKFDPASAIIPAVVEFQKAQCYFMLATNIASLIVQDKGGLSPDSFQQLYNTFIFVKVIAIGGYLPITFGLLTLRMLNKVGWYILILSMASVAVAIGDLYTEQVFTPSPTDVAYLRDQSLKGGPAECGGNNPMAWCYNRIGVNYYGFRATNSGDGADDILTICLITLALLVIEHFWHSPDHTNREMRDFIFKRHRRRVKTDRSKRIKEVVQWSWKYIVPILFAIVVIIYVYCFAVFANDLDWFRVNLIYDSSWGFGQIVAILVWAPAIIEYFWQSFRGIEDASDYRLPDGYEVRKKDDDSNGGSVAVNEANNNEKQV